MAEQAKPGATGIGGVFLKCEDPGATQSWYREHLGIPAESYGYSFRWRERAQPDNEGYTVWGTFAKDTEYFQPADSPVMLNFRVRGLDTLLAQMTAAGVKQVGQIQQEPNGRFAWVMDPDGRKIELWEPVPSAEDPYLEG